MDGKHCLILTVHADAATDRELGTADMSNIHDLFGYSYMVGHRSSLAGGLYGGCLKHKDAIQFNFSTRALDFDVTSTTPSFYAHPRDGPAYKVDADILLASDGVKSRARDALLKTRNAAAKIEDTGQAAYRIMLTRQQVETDPDLLELLQSRQLTRWIAPGRHIIAYPVSDHAIYNISTLQRDTNFAAAPSETYTTHGSAATMRAVFADFCPRVQRMLALVSADQVCEWKLRVHGPLPTWHTGRTALLGDAAHPTLPHLAQGAAQAVEDAAVLGVVLSAMPDSGAASIARAFELYESVRKGRAEALVEMAAATGRTMHLPSGAAQKARDEQLRRARKGGANPEKWADGDVQRLIYGFDCVQVAREACQLEGWSI